MKPTAYVPTSGPLQHRPPKDGKHYQLAELQEMVGGYIETVRTPNGMILVVDEEGLLKRKPINISASFIARRTIVGDAVYAHPGFFERG